MADRRVPVVVPKTFMSKTSLLDTAAALATTWRSTVVGRAGRSQLKVLRMDGASYPAEAHPFDEALLVLDGVMNLEVNGSVVAVKTGEVYMVPAGQVHSVAPGSHGTLVVIDEVE